MSPFNPVGSLCPKQVVGKELVVEGSRAYRDYCTYILRTWGLKLSVSSVRTFLGWYLSLYLKYMGQKVPS